MNLIKLLEDKDLLHFLVLLFVLISVTLTAYSVTYLSTLRSKASTAYGNCSVSPNPINQDFSFAISGSGFGRDQQLNIELGESSFQLIADNRGQFSKEWHLNSRGKTTIIISDVDNSPLARCSVVVN